MDYTDLKITKHQIRLLSILPASPADSSGPVECSMTVRPISLPPTVKEDEAGSGHVPENYISFDKYVTDPPPEMHVQELRELLAPILDEIAKDPGATLKAMREALPDELKQEAELVVHVTYRAIIDLLSGEEKIRVMTSIGDSSRPGGMKRRILMEGNNIIEAFEDEAGYATFFGETSMDWGAQKGSLRPADVNPFFRLPGTAPEKAEKESTGKSASDSDEWNYVAMSYCWGPEQPTADIIVNGKVTKVRANLEAGLRQFRDMEYFREGGKIWIDSLCINQEDIPEKQDQLQMMASIYRYAGNIIVWLGTEADDSDQAIYHLENAGRDFRSEYVEALDSSDPITATTWRTMAQIRMETSYDALKEKSKILEHEMSAPFFNEIAATLYKFFDRPYWRRLWIIQELCMGRSGMPIVCGKRVTQWRYIRDGVLKLMAILDLLDERFREKFPEQIVARPASLEHVAQIAQLEIMCHRRKIPEVPDNQLPLIAATWFEYGPLLGSALRRAVALASQSECSNSHDRIYGLLSIPGLPDLDIKIDYSKHLAQVFTEFSAASKPKRRIGILDGEWHAGGYVPVSFCKPYIGPQCQLFCQGKIVDVVNGTGAMSKADIDSGAIIFDPDDDLRPVQQPWKSDEELENQSPSRRGESVIHDVLVGGCDKSGRPAPDSFKCLYTAFPVEEPPVHSPFYRNWHFLNSSAELMVHGKPLASYFLHMTPPPASSDATENMSPPIETAAARQAMEARTKMRRLIVTEAGFLGLAPAQTRPGDSVILIVGHPKPLIARRGDHVGHQQYWYLIGEAYIAGLMGVEKMPLSDKPWYFHETMRTMAELETIAFE
ncbi:HET-domain-containing protein [Echria macrotheca]|uniref:HET-domain-containing protein n=1 Tax=Echria macrotheca TaxID=438768 RepID=A0AAJ0F8Q1_9PEZI|nr:HET-domain-containing protein [Echria macrotheca]